MKIHEIYVRNTRDELGRYPTWPIQRRISLGDIALYHGRSAQFEFVGSLKRLGISVTPTPAQGLMSELYTTVRGVDCEFGLGTAGSTSAAKFSFKRNNAVATQGFQMAHCTLPLDRLKGALVQAVSNDGIEWNPDWLIVTELWEAAAFTTLIAATKGSESEVAAGQLIVGHAFNVADINLGLHIARSRSMAYQGVALADVKPYFQVHKLIQDSKRGPYLKIYGKDQRLFGKNWRRLRALVP